MIVSVHIFVEVYLGPHGKFLVLLVDPVDSVDCLLVLGAHADLLQLSLFLALCLLLVKLLDFLPEFIGLLFLIGPVSLLSVLVQPESL